MYSNRPNAGLLVNYGLRSAQRRILFSQWSLWVESSCRCVVFASSVVILVKSVDSIGSFMLQLLKQSQSTVSFRFAKYSTVSFRFAKYSFVSFRKVKLFSYLAKSQ